MVAKYNIIQGCRKLFYGGGGCRGGGGGGEAD